MAPSSSAPRDPASTLEVYLNIGHETELCRVEEVGRRGLFLQTSRPYPPQQLVHLSIGLPSGEVITVHGMVEDAIAPDEAAALGTAPGVSVRFYGLGKDAREAWESHLAEVGVTTASSAPAESWPPLETPGPSPSWAREHSILIRAQGAAPPSPVKAAATTPRPRVLIPNALVGHVVYRLNLPTTEAVKTFGDTVLRTRALFVKTRDLRPVGTTAIICVIHPETKAEFHLPGEICPTADPKRPGVTVTLPTVTPRTVTAFRRFATALAWQQPEEASDEAPYAELSIDELSREYSTAELSGLFEENTLELKVEDVNALLVTPTTTPKC